MNFQIKALPLSSVSHLFALSDSELAEHRARRHKVTSKPGTPCRVSMTDADIGDTVILLNYQHQPEQSPYQASHAIFVRETAQEVRLGINEVPEVIRLRLISVRLFDKDHMMVGADVVEGEKVGATISTAFEKGEVAYIHLHNAKPGCFAAAVYRA